MRLGSLFDGSGGFPLAGALCGIEPIWASEVEPYPIAVTKSRFPNMKHLGDISKINGAEIEPVDIITFGSPCQDLSVAGKRAGLKHEDNGDDETTRSGLFMEAVRIIKEMREKTNGEYPRFAVWENVPGAFSSNKGEDFRLVLEELIKIVEPSAVMPKVPRFGWAYADSYCGNGWSLAYRVLDAQYWGVPQRRRRIYLVADFGGQCAREILFEREGLRGYFTEGRTPWKTTPTYVERGVGADDREGETVSIGADPYNGEITGDKSSTLGVNCGMSSGRQSVIAFEPGAAKRLGGYAWEDVAGTLRAEMGDNQTAVAYGIEEPIAVATQQGGAEITENGICPTITAAAGMSGNNQPWICQGLDAYNQALTGDKSKTLNSAATDADHVPCTVYSVENHPNDSRVKIDESGKVQSLTGRMGTGGGNVPMVMEQTPFCKSRRAQTADDATTWKDGKVANTLNTFDQGEARANELIVETIALEGNGQRPSHQGDGYAVTDKSYTLNATEKHGVAYSFDPGASRDVGVLFIEECGKTLTNGTCPGHHDGVVIATNPIEQAIQAIKEVYRYSGVGSGLHIVIDDENIEDHHILWCLEHSIQKIENDAERKACEVCAKLLLELTYEERERVMELYWRGSTILTANKASFFMNTDENLAGTLVATDYKDPQLVAFDTAQHKYIVRRLTPTECARLQGFADRWGDIDPKTELSDAEYKFWLDVRNTHAAINGKATKEYTKAQMLAWYNKLHTDSAEYKLWGNGIALPTALYVIQGIAETTKGETNND